MVSLNTFVKSSLRWHLALGKMLFWNGHCVCISHHITSCTIVTQEKHDQQSVELKLVISKTNQLTGFLKCSINFVSSHGRVVL